MSVDALQDKIRKMKNPSVIDFTVTQDMIPECIAVQGGSYLQQMERYCMDLLEGLQHTVPAVRFSMGSLALLEGEGLQLLTYLLRYAKSLGYYVLLEGPMVLSATQAQLSAQQLFSDQTGYEFDGLILSAYLGEDVLKPFAEKLKDTGKTLFAVVRTGNKSASAVLDLMTGSRLVHAAIADLVNRLGEPLPGRSGYHKLGAVAGAGSADSLRMLRGKYQRLFLLLDGYDYSHANAKTCSAAFDKLGHGAAACAGASVLAAWREEPQQQQNYVQLAVAAAENMKRNLTRYVSIL